jgi:twitching motility protein PilT
MTAYIDDVIRDLLGRGVEFSDIHAIPGELVRYRGGAGLIAESGDPLDDADLAEFLSVHAGPRPWDARLSDGGGQFDFATSLDGVRFRCHVHRHGGCGAMALVLRKLDNRIRDLVDIGLPETVLALLQRRSGLVLVTGPTGAGKTTTLASFIDHLNRNVSWKIVTIEDPIEYMHRSRRSMIVQREVGRDVDSFAQGLVASFREDPDCIMIGEIRDRETVETALAAAEAGHLVLAGVVSQVLIPRADGTGRALAYEIVHNVPSVATLIRGGKAHQIGNAVSTAGMPDMQLLNRTLALMVRAGLVARDQALVASYDARELERELVARDTLLGPR